MKLRHAAAAALGFAACTPAPTAHRGSSSTVTTSADPESPGSSGSAGPSTTLVVTLSSLAPTTTEAEAPATTTTVRLRALPTTTLPESHGGADEWDARDAATARVSWYGAESGSHTANGDVYDPNGLTFAHLSMPFGTRVTFRGPLGSVTATCTDRGPSAWTGKTFDLSRGAFARVAPLAAGVAVVTWEVVG